jgi:hypothetical protein
LRAQDRHTPAFIVIGLVLAAFVAVKSAPDKRPAGDLEKLAIQPAGRVILHRGGIRPDARQPRPDGGSSDPSRVVGKDAPHWMAAASAQRSIYEKPVLRAHEPGIRHGTPPGDERLTLAGKSALGITISAALAPFFCHMPVGKC